MRPRRGSYAPLGQRAHWLEESLYFNHPSYFTAVEEALRSACQSIDVEMYIFEPEGRFESLLNLLKEAAARGLRVRVLVDGIGSPGWVFEQLHSLAAAGVHSRVFHPAPWPLSPASLSGGKLPRRLLRRMSRINRRDHRKLFIVDRQLAFTGSMNATERHRDWRDTGIRVRGREVLDLEASFDLIWCRSYNPGIPRERRTPVRETVAQMASQLVKTNTTLRLRRQNYRGFLHRVACAEQRVWITTPYFIPGPQLLRVLSRAARRGVDVRLLLPGINDIAVVRWVSRLYYQTLITNGVRLFEYQPTVLHAKTLVVDDWARVGTSNLNYRSRYHDLEVDLVATQQRTIEALANQYRLDLLQSQEVRENNSPWLERLGGYLGLLFRRWL